MITVCEGDEQCLYDSKAMGSLEIGVMTRNAHRYYRFLDQAMKPGRQFSFSFKRKRFMISFSNLYVKYF